MSFKVYVNWGKGTLSVRMILREANDAYDWKPPIQIGKMLMIKKTCSEHEDDENKKEITDGHSCDYDEQR